MTPNPVKPQKKMAQRVSYCDSWWPAQHDSNVRPTP